MKQEEIEMLEVEMNAAFLANSYIHTYEKINLLGNQEYGKPYLSEENIGLRQYSN